MLYAVRCLKSNEDMSLALAGQFKQLSYEPENSGDSTGFEPMTSAMPVQCSHQLSYEVTQWTGEQVNLLGSCFPVKGMSCERMLYAVRCLKSNEDMILALASARIISSFDFNFRIPLSHLKIPLSYLKA